MFQSHILKPLSRSFTAIMDSVIFWSRKDHILWNLGHFQWSKSRFELDNKLCAVQIILLLWNTRDVFYPGRDHPIPMELQRIVLHKMLLESLFNTGVLNANICMLRYKEARIRHK